MQPFHGKPLQDGQLLFDGIDGALQLYHLRGQKRGLASGEPPESFQLWLVAQKDGKIIRVMHRTDRYTVEQKAKLFCPPEKASAVLGFNPDLFEADTGWTENDLKDVGLVVPLDDDDKPSA